MKIFRATIALLLTSLAAVSAQQTFLKPFDALSVNELASLKMEVRQWRDSHAGQNAIKNGFVPSSTISALALLMTASSPVNPNTLNSPQMRSKSPAVPENINAANASTSGNASLRELLKRYHDGKLRIADLKKTQPKATFSMQTPFALMTPEEYQAFVGRRNVIPSEMSSLLNATTKVTRHLREMANPASVDWVAEGKVTTPRDQGHCMADIVFATIAAIESGYAIATGNPVPSLSEQDAISCGPLQGSCNLWSGILNDPISWIVNYNGGSTCTLDSFPFGGWSADTVACARYDDPTKACVKPDLGVVGYYENEFQDPVDLEALVAVHPVAAGINSSPTWFQHYTGGILMGDENSCPSENINHMVAIVGYDTSSDGTKFWKVKNSWSQWWGEGGYFRIERGYQGATYGACGIRHYGISPVFRAQNPDADSLRCLPKKAGHKTLGYVYKIVTVPSTSMCCDICRSDDACLATNFLDSGTTCALLATITGDQREDTVFTIHITSKNTIHEMCTPVENNVDYGANDLMRLMTTSPGDCCDACTRNSDCLAYTWSQWNTGSCFLKTHRGSNINTHTPNTDGSPYYVSGEVYKCGALMSNQDFPGQDLSSAAGAQAYSCCGICRSTTGCAAFTWTNYNGGTCWLKTGSANPGNNPGAISAAAAY